MQEIELEHYDRSKIRMLHAKRQDELVSTSLTSVQKDSRFLKRPGQRPKLTDSLKLSGSTAHKAPVLSADKGKRLPAEPLRRKGRHQDRQAERRDSVHEDPSTTILRKLAAR